jgi:hypothetical protein
MLLMLLVLAPGTSNVLLIITDNTSTSPSTIIGTLIVCVGGVGDAGSAIRRGELGGS